MNFWRKIYSIGVAGAILLSGMTGILPGILVSAETSEEKTYVQKGDTGEEGETRRYVYLNSWEITYHYVIDTQQHWDNDLGAVVYDSQEAQITKIRISEVCTGAMQAPDTYDETNWTLAVPPKEVTVAIPETLEDITVTSVSDNITVSQSFMGWYSPTSIQLSIPTNIDYQGENVIEPSVSGSYGMYLGETHSVYHPFSGTCKELLDNGYRGTYNCTDGDIVTYTDQKTNETLIKFTGTCAEWRAICPADLAEIRVTCSDGEVNAPLVAPDDSHYTFDTDKATACLVQVDSSNISSLTVPDMVYDNFAVTGIGDGLCQNCDRLSSLSIGKNVTTIGEEAFLCCPALTAISIPSTVTNIGAHAFGFWKNSDGSYSPMSTVTIYCEEGSAAHAYAIDNGLNYSFETTPTVTTTVTTTTTATTTATTTTTIRLTYPQTTASCPPVTTKNQTTAMTTNRTTTTSAASSTTTTSSSSTPIDKYPLIQMALSSTAMDEAVGKIVIATPLDHVHIKITKDTPEGIFPYFDMDIHAKIKYEFLLDACEPVPSENKTNKFQSDILTCNYNSAYRLTITANDETILEESTILIADIDYEPDVTKMTEYRYTVESVPVGSKPDNTRTIILRNGTLTIQQAVYFETSAPSDDILYGDVNTDGKVELVDAILLNKACAGQVTLTEEARANGDCNADGVTDTTDAIILLRFLVHLEASLPCTEG